MARDQQELQRLTALAVRKPRLDVAREGMAQAERDLTALGGEEAAAAAICAREVAVANAQLSAVQRELSGLATEDATGTLAALDLRTRLILP
ncbi:hypothetical protein [Cupriavidus sp. IDO]|uniref:hypothetical protein n=1 Tax=Cupriavidus sp. IDO TaxID=1539142 RepID=UPI00126A1391|nr:hypothetical protein [Cupriavidus sp. IDO]